MNRNTALAAALALLLGLAFARPQATEAARAPKSLVAPLIGRECYFETHDIGSFPARLISADETWLKFKSGSGPEQFMPATQVIKVRLAE